ncbi:MAG: 3',5'-cyclic-AMP phosphodiesterase [Pseudomonas sp.]|nr:3',5'-cyclic-AMP phosphodiesterase [Pseudomonas sp.]
MQPLKAPAYITVVQLSDSHLFASSATRLLGMDTRHSLQHVIELARAEQSQIDLVLCTGDISQDASAMAYQRFAEMAGSLGAPMRWFAGNHDERLALQQACTGTDRLEPVYDLGAWRMVMLDSSVAGRVHGELAQDQLQILEQALSTAGARHVLVALHHHPVPVGSRWIDAIGLHHAEHLHALISCYSNVKVVLWGHVHQEFDQQMQGVRWLAAPSTCVQFTTHSDDFAVDDQAPGYRWLRLYDDGHLETGVSRVTGVEFELDINSGGY